MMRNLSLLLILLSGCSISIWSDAVDDPVKLGETFSGLKSVGLGETNLEAERDAWHDAAARLRAKGYTSFELRQTGKSTSTTSSGDKHRVEMTASWKVTEAVRGTGGTCPCGKHTCQQHDDH